MQDVFDMVNENASAIDETQEPVVFGELGITAEVTEKPSENHVAEVTEMPEEYLMGIVKTAALYVRSAPDKNAAPLGVINKGASLIIDKTQSTDQYYSVITESGIEGFCMKEFIKIQ